MRQNVIKGLEVLFSQPRKHGWIIFIFNQGTIFSWVMFCSFGFFNSIFKRTLVLFLGLNSVPVQVWFYEEYFIYYFCVIIPLSSLPTVLTIYLVSATIPLAPRGQHRLMYALFTLYFGSKAVTFSPLIHAGISWSKHVWLLSRHVRLRSVAGANVILH